MYANIYKFVKIHIVQKHHFSSRAFKDIKIPVPWGNVAGKWYAPYDKVPILAMHGWQDNCGTFDTLIPLLPNNIGIMAIDFPGHGLSSHLPSGIMYNTLDLPILIRRILQYFKWEKVTLMGHSMGALHGFIYTILYPENVQHLIFFDGLYPLPMPHEGNKKNVDNIGPQNIDRFLKYDTLNNGNKNNRVASTLSISEMEELLHKGSGNTILLKNCHYLLKRSINESTTNPKKYYFIKDQRLKTYATTIWHYEEIIKYSRRITCPMCLIIADNNPMIVGAEKFWDIVDNLKKHNHKVECHLMKGTHHLHLNHPETIKDIVIEFFQRYGVGNE